MKIETDLYRRICYVFIFENKCDLVYVYISQRVIL